MVESWVRNLTEDVIGGSPVEIGKRYTHPEDGPIEITRGSYWGKSGLSNFWHWTVLSTGESHHGYGQYWPEITRES
jgi:hypothetical protein